MKDKTKILLFIVLSIFTLISTILIFKTSLIFNNDKSLVLLSQQFLSGHLSLAPDRDLPVGDVAKYNGKYYIYFGPLASILLAPFVAVFGRDFPQITIGFLSMIVSFFAVYKISQFFKFSRIDSLWLSLFFVFSTVLFANSIINITSYLVEALSVPLILLSLMFYFTRKPKPLFIGLFLGLAIMTRVTLIVAIVFFIFEFLRKRLNLKQITLIFIPVVVCLTILGIYNYVRFNNIVQTGYDHHIGDPYPLSENSKGFGNTNISHIPANLYVFFIKPPDPITTTNDGYVFEPPYLKADPWGMAIWFTSPLFLMMILNFKKNQYFKSSLFATIFIAIPIFTWYSVGFAQFGYRYALDFLPFIFLLLIPCLQSKLSKAAIILITIGILFNCLYITSLWDVYPHFGIM